MMNQGEEVASVVLDNLETTSDYGPGSDDCSSDTLKTVLEEGFSHEDVIEDIEDGTSSVLSSSLSSNECLASRAPWATPPIATVELGHKLRKQNPALPFEAFNQISEPELVHDKNHCASLIYVVERPIFGRILHSV